MRIIDEDDVIKAVDKHTFETKDGLCLDDDISVILEDVPTIEEWKIDNRKYSVCPHQENLLVVCSHCGYIMHVRDRYILMMIRHKK